MICGSAGWKSRLVKEAGAEPCVQGRHEKLHAAVARSAFSSKNAEKADGLGAFLEVQMSKLHAAVARSSHAGPPCSVEGFRVQKHTRRLSSHQSVWRPIGDPSTWARHCSKPVSFAE